MLQSILIKASVHRLILMPTNLSRTADNLALTGMIALTQTAIGCGIGLLLCSKLNRSAQRTAALVMLSLGTVSTLPVLFGIFSRQWNRPESARGMRRRLESIRRSGVSDDADVF
jgi:hypothetical protein